MLYLGFFLHRKYQTKQLQSYTLRLPRVKGEHPTLKGAPGCALSAGAESPGLVPEAVTILSRSWHSHAQDLLFLTLLHRRKVYQSMVLKRSQIPEVGPQGHSALTTSNLEQTQGCPSPSQFSAKAPIPVTRAFVNMGPAFS